MKVSYPDKAPQSAPSIPCKNTDVKQTRFWQQPYRYTLPQAEKKDKATTKAQTTAYCITIGNARTVRW